MSDREQHPTEPPQPTTAYGAGAARGVGDTPVGDVRGSDDARPRKRLTRSRTDRKIAGVCGGLGAYFGVDPLLFRVLFVVGAVAAGPGLVAYLVLWAVMPQEPRPAT